MNADQAGAYIVRAIARACPQYREVAERAFVNGEVLPLIRLAEGVRDGLAFEERMRLDECAALAHRMMKGARYARRRARMLGGDGG